MPRIVDPVARRRTSVVSRTFRWTAYDAALVCIPDAPKIELLRYLLEHGKHVLVEKPLCGTNDDDLRALEALARRTGALCYTAYNHRFEPHFVRMRELLATGELGSDLSLPHVLRQWHRTAGAQLGLARHGRRRARAISARICSTPSASGSATSPSSFPDRLG